MSQRQDITSVRTAADIEQKYGFGRKFSEILGLIDESRDKVDSVESGIRSEITKMETTLKRDTESIVATAKKEITQSVTDIVDDATGEIRDDITEISSQVILKLDAEAVNIAVEKKLSNGVDQVTTATGYRFDASGLNISKAGEEMTNLLDNTGMYVKRSGDDILVANNKGVEAVNLHAKTYLIIGSGEGRSRIEDYGNYRTGVFWIG